MCNDMSFFTLFEHCSIYTHLHTKKQLKICNLSLPLVLPACWLRCLLWRDLSYFSPNVLLIQKAFQPRSDRYNSKVKNLVFSGETSCSPPAGGTNNFFISKIVFLLIFIYKFYCLTNSSIDQKRWANYSAESVFCGIRSDRERQARMGDLSESSLVTPLLLAKPFSNAV